MTHLLFAGARPLFSDLAFALTVVFIALIWVVMIVALAKLFNILPEILDEF